jgi:hypothetical protein
MDYQKAKDIRGKSFSSLLIDNIVGGGGAPLSKTISAKTQANVQGIKQAFDPLQIAKTLTFGSNFAPALLGRAMGRSKKDIKFFTGRTRKRSSSFASALDNSASGVGQSNPAVEALGGIYDLLVEKDELRKQDILDREKESKQEEDYAELYNRELIKALTARRKPAKGKKEQYRDEKGRFAKEPSVETPKGATTSKPTPPAPASTPNPPPVSATPKPTPTAPASTPKPTPTAPASTPKPSPATSTPKPPLVKLPDVKTGSIVASAAAAISILGETSAKTPEQALKKGGQIVGNDPSPGYYSYGIFGMNSKSKTIDAFVAQNPQLGFKEKPGTKEFNEEWKKVASGRAKELYDAQMNWYEKNVFEPLKKDLSSKLPNGFGEDPRVISYFADRRIQYGKVQENSAIEYAKASSTPIEFLEKITDYDLNTLNLAFPTALKNNPNIRKGLENRVKNRKSLALSINNSGNVIVTGTRENQELKESLNKDKRAQDTVTNNITTNTNQKTEEREEPADDKPAFMKKRRM